MTTKDVESGGGEYQGFEESLRQRIAKYEGPKREMLTHAPDLFRTLADLLEDPRVPRECRGPICAGIAYFVVPFDVVAEEIFGPEGYLDDLFLAADVLLRVRPDLPPGVLEECWRLPGPADEVLADIHRRTAAELGDRTKAIFDYVGLEAPEAETLKPRPR